ncbi:MAG: ankyrin repeat domain-containing protein [Acidobacteriota bacterium]|nr:ankyrin repeat domain-containing protein [Acidobacteriota bacterium]
MIRAPRRRISSVAASLALLVALSACRSLGPAPHSRYRAIHEYAINGEVERVSADIASTPGDLNLPDDAGDTPLHLAAMHCRMPVIVFLVTKRAAVNRKDRGGATALHLAAQEGCLPAVTSLLGSGAKVNARDKAHRTPLKRAQEAHNGEIATVLRQHGGVE